jgi:hypothetical protein
MQPAALQRGAFGVGGQETISVREHPKHGFYAEGLVEVVVGLYI